MFIVSITQFDNLCITVLVLWVIIIHLLRERSARCTDKELNADRSADCQRNAEEMAKL